MKNRATFLFVFSFFLFTFFSREANLNFLRVIIAHAYSLGSAGLLMSSVKSLPERT